jgi:hypothetical protein
VAAQIGFEALFPPMRDAILDLVNPERAIHRPDEIESDVSPVRADANDPRHIQRNAAALLASDCPRHFGAE